MPSPSARFHRPLVLLAALGVGGGVSLAGCSSRGASVSTGDSFGSAGRAAGGSASGSGKVTIKNYIFGPNSINVKAGGTVSWNNTDQFDHSVSEDDGGFSGEPIHPGASFSHTYATPGTYKYHCGIHNYMTGVVTVTS